MPAQDRPPSTVDADGSIVARRNDSLGRATRWHGFGALAAGSLALAFALAAGGAWPILPFSVLELACLALAFAWIERRARDYDRLTVEDDRVVVERRVAGRLERRELARAWLRVDVDRRGRAGEPAIVLRAGRDALPFGDHVPAAERLALARRLKLALAAPPSGAAAPTPAPQHP